MTEKRYSVRPCENKMKIILSNNLIHLLITHFESYCHLCNFSSLCACLANFVAFLELGCTIFLQCTFDFPSFGCQKEHEISELLNKLNTRLCIVENIKLRCSEVNPN